MVRAVKTAALAISAAIVLCAGAFQIHVQAAPAGGGLKVWTCDIVTEETATKTKELKPLTLVGARNGSYSGKIVVESGSAIKGLRAAAGALSGTAGTIPAKDIHIRYAKSWNANNQWTWPAGDDILLEAAPDVPVEKTSAMLPVWVTVSVPKDAKPGSYSGEVTVQPSGAAAVKVPVKLDVENWTLPDPQDYRTWMDFVESPDTLALEYKVPLWSDKHWDLIAQSFRQLSATGARSLYVPLICHTNLGNEQSMVRWIPRGDNRYEYDYSVMDKYLDTAEKNLGKPKLVIFQVWDICMSLESLKRGLWDPKDSTGKARQELLDKGPRVTALDPNTKEASVLTLPRYEDPASIPLWKPMFAEIRKHMEKRGLDKVMMLGLMPDLWPSKDESHFWNDISGNLPWAIHGHAGEASGVGIGKKGLNSKTTGAADIGYAAFVYDLVFNVNPDKGRLYGWRNPALLTNYLRGGELNMASPLEIREFPAFNITGGQRGGGRMGADFWKVLTNKKGQREGAVYQRYPENNWRNLDISDWFLAPGPDGPVATARLEELKEGIQECEARISIEDALLDPAKKAKLGDELAKSSQDDLDDLHRAMWKTVWTKEDDLAFLGKIGTGRNPPEGLWNALEKAKRLPVMIDKKSGKQEDFWGSDARQLRSEEAGKGEAWFATGWQDRSKKLFDFAGQVAAKLDEK